MLNYSYSYYVEFIYHLANIAIGHIKQTAQWQNNNKKQQQKTTTKNKKQKTESFIIRTQKCLPYMAVLVLFYSNMWGK